MSYHDVKLVSTEKNTFLIGIVSLFYPYLCQYDVWYIELLKEGKCVNPLNPKIKTKILICRLYSFTTEAAGRS